MGELTAVVGRLDRDLRESVASLSIEEARFLVRTYYMMQDNRIRAEHQSRQLEKSEKQHMAITWLSEQSMALETRVKQLLDKWTDSQPVGKWLKSITGIGPVIAAGLLAHIDIEKAPTAGCIWRYFGLDPTLKRVKGEKLRYNPDAKVLAFKAGESFVKQQGRDSDYYGKLYAQRKEYERKKNEAGDYKEEAARVLATRNFSRETDTKTIYQSGKLPPAHLHARARRHTVKLFLAHVHEEMYRQHFGKEPPLPYPIAHLNHVSKIPPPNHE